MTMDPNAIGAWIATASIGAWGILQQQRRKRAEGRAETAQSTLTAGSMTDLAQRNTDLVKSYREKADEWKTLFEQQHHEIGEYRKEVHAKAEKENADKLKLVEENTRLNARTDLTPILDHLEAQSRTNEKVAETVNALTQTVNTLAEGVNRLMNWLSQREETEHESARNS